MVQCTMVLHSGPVAPLPLSCPMWELAGALLALKTPTSPKTKTQPKSPPGHTHSFIHSGRKTRYSYRNPQIVEGKKREEKNPPKKGRKTRHSTAPKELAVHKLGHDPPPLEGDHGRPVTHGR